jgi:hypothetical protein
LSQSSCNASLFDSGKSFIVLPSSFFDAIELPIAKHLKALGRPRREIAISSRIREVAKKSLRR